MREEKKAAPADVAVPSEEREAFEAWYCDQMAKAGYGPDCTIHDLREENHYGEHRVMLNGKWEGWQARAALAAAAAPQPPVAVQEPVASVYTMEALVPGAHPKCHVDLLKPLPAGTKLYTHPAPQPAPVAQPAILGPEHKGMRVDYSGLFKQARGALARGIKEPALAEMLRQFQGHMQELGQRWYAGDTAVIDELLQLYCIEQGARAQAKEGGA